MKTYNCKDKPLKIFGVPFFEQTKCFERLPLSLRDHSETMRWVGRRCPGARLGFRTDAQEFTVKIGFESVHVDIGMGIYAGQSASVQIGQRQNSVFAGLVNPPNYSTRQFQATFKKRPVMEEITIWLPRDEILDYVEVELPDDAKVEEPTPYKLGTALYYGSSITESACCCNVNNGYNALLCRWLDLDYYNFGFSGNALGEPEMADYINTIDMNMFVLDYDHNAPSAEHLKKTHEPFFRRIREKHPNLPILMLSMPDFDYKSDAKLRREIIEQTYKNAVSDGDKNVYFIDGETFFGTEDRHLCTIDTVHPNDLGFYRMAKVILPTVKKMLKCE